MTELPVMVQTTPEEIDLVVEALRSESSRRQRAATRASSELLAETGAGKVKDKRPGSVKIVAVLGQAASLDAFAGKLIAARAATQKVLETYETSESPLGKETPMAPETPTVDTPEGVVVQNPEDETPAERIARLLTRDLPGGGQAEEVTSVEQDDGELLDPDAEGDDEVDVIGLIRDAEKAGA